MTPIKAIRAKCLDCCCGQASEVALCVCEDCSLYPYRFGKNPNRKCTMTDEQRLAASERLRRLNLERKASLSVEENEV